jgi:drug/metabolite transporter (DMT)-like permease
MPFLWVIVTVVATGLQVGRNALQRGLIGDAGPWGATLVRFLFGLPFSIAFTLVVTAVLNGRLHPQLSPSYWIDALTGAATQMVATAALLVAMRRAGFAVGTTLQQSSLPLAAILGLVIFHDTLSPLGWAGVVVTTVGLVILTWPKQAVEGQLLSGSAFGILSGLCFGFSLNAYRHAARMLEPHHPLFAAVATVTLTQAAQSLVLVAYLAWRHPWALRAVAASWRKSLGAGFCGAAASALWLLALALAPAASVRAVAVVETPIAVAAGRRMFKEKLSLGQWIAALFTTVGVVMTALHGGPG